MAEDVLPNQSAIPRQGARHWFWALTALSAKPSGKILLPATILRLYFKPVFSKGLSIEYYDLDDELQPIWPDVERRLSKDVIALYINHYFGRTSDVSKAQSLCRKYDVAFIEDCAHAFASKINGKFVGGFGDISLFSL